MQATVVNVSQVSQLQRSRRLVLASDSTTPPVVLFAVAILALAVAIIHLQDQGGLLGGQSPTWLKYGYYLVEISSTISAGLLLRAKIAGWMLGLASTIGPFVGYILSRSVGIPGDSGDIGNWGYTLGIVSLIVEGSFVLVAIWALSGLIGPWYGARGSTKTSLTLGRHPD